VEEFHITSENEPTDEDMSVFDTLRDYNTVQVGPSGHQPLTLFVRDEVGQAVGGLRGTTHWGWLYVSMLVIREPVRRLGWGSLLLTEAEAEAAKRGCRHAYLDTFNLQARAFYEKNGYTVFGTLDDFPLGGHQRFFLKKDLTSSEEE
jgi:ribosomal protein S18 acetylase RimI-like enzyme